MEWKAILEFAQHAQSSCLLAMVSELLFDPTFRPSSATSEAVLIQRHGVRPAKPRLTTVAGCQHSEITKSGYTQG